MASSSFFRAALGALWSPAQEAFWAGLDSDLGIANALRQLSPAGQ